MSASSGSFRKLHAHRSRFQVVLSLCIAAACLRGVAAEEWDVMPQGDIAGPVVKSQPAETIDAVSKAEKGAEAATDAAAPSQEGVDPAAKKTIAQMLDEALEQEFPKEAESTSTGKHYNETAKKEDATVETVIKVSGNRKADKEKAVEGNATSTATTDPVTGVVTEPLEAANATAKSKPKIEPAVEKEVDRIIDSQDNEYVLSKPKEQSMGLTLDPQLIRDLTVLIVSSSLVGAGMEALGQPVINGYFIAGSLVGSGSLGWVKEIVQVQSVAQLGVSLLLFTLGLEFSLTKLRAVRGVALVGGVLEVVLLAILSGVFAKIIGGRTHEGIFTGLLVAMSSTSIVVKCLADSKTSNTAVGQITIGTLILQDCMVGLIFAFMPLLTHATSEPAAVDHVQVAMVVLKVLMTLVATVMVAMFVAQVVLQPVMKMLATSASHELYQLTLVAFCLFCANVTGYLGLSTELGAFIGGVMLSVTDQHESAVHATESVTKLFVALFIASTGLILSPVFLLQHLPVLTAGLLLVVVTKTLLFSFVVWIFGYSTKTCVAVGLSMAQIGEFAFVLLSIARSSDIIQHQLYMLLMGVTALSLLLTPSLLQASRWLQLEHPHQALPLLLDHSMNGKIKYKCDSFANGQSDEQERPGTAQHSARQPPRERPSSAASQRPNTARQDRDREPNTPTRSPGDRGGFSNASQAGLQQRSLGP